MKKKILSILLACSMVFSMAACGGNTDTQGSATGNGTSTGGAASGSTDEKTTSELVDGKFAETRKIVVEIYDRGNDGGSDPTNNMYTEYIKKGMLEDHVKYTNSVKGKEILNNFEEYLPKFKKIIPYDYKKMLNAIAKMEEKGLNPEQAQIEAFHIATK